ncbi:MAG: DUF5371 family protein [Archaeoglobaceae archaeon]
MRRFVIINIKFSEDIIHKLKEKTEEKTTKEAISKAVYHYIRCHHKNSDIEV